jgi:hypothetical protein
LKSLFQNLGNWQKKKRRIMYVKPLCTRYVCG